MSQHGQLLSDRLAKGSMTAQSTPTASTPTRASAADRATTWQPLKGTLAAVDQRRARRSGDDAGVAIRRGGDPVVAAGRPKGPIGDELTRISMRFRGRSVSDGRRQPQTAERTMPGNGRRHSDGLRDGPRIPRLPRNGHGQGPRSPGSGCTAQGRQPTQPPSTGGTWASPEPHRGIWTSSAFLDDI